MKPVDLGEVTPVEPDGSPRAVARAQRVRSLRIGIAGIAIVLVLGLVATLAWARSDKARTRVSVTAPTITTPSKAQLSSHSLIGQWRPISIVGFRGPLTSPPLVRMPVLAFNNATAWTGSDGCNQLTGSYQLHADGAFEIVGYIRQTQIGCSPPDVVPTGAVLTSTARVKVLEDQLTLHARDGRTLALYRRSKTPEPNTPATTSTPQARKTPTNSAAVQDASAETAIRDAFLGWIDAQPHDAAGPYVQDFASIVGAVRRGMAQHSAADLARYSGRVDSVAIVDGTHASVRYSILFDGTAQYADQPGEAIKNGGVWMVSRDTVCHLLTYGGITC